MEHRNCSPQEHQWTSNDNDGYDNDVDDDDGLGYYADGIKRTLTDEQIAMFRHSEIQSLLRERRLVRERLDERSSPSSSLFHGQDNLHLVAPITKGGLLSAGKSLYDDDHQNTDFDQASETNSMYEAFLQQEQEQLRHSSRASKTLLADAPLEYGDDAPTFSNRNNNDDNQSILESYVRGRKVISYDDTTIAATPDEQPKRFIWPRIG